MRLFDVLGPVMTGPSSSHTAGAVRIGSTARRLLGEQPAQAEILLYGSFAATGRGHGTDRALVAGLLGMQPDDDRIPNSFALAKASGLHYKIGSINLRGAHPNTAVLRLVGVSGRKLEVVGASIGGGRINICQIDGITTNFGGDHNTLIVHNQDTPGHVAPTASTLLPCSSTVPQRAATPSWCWNVTSLSPKKLPGNCAASPASSKLPF